jgi:hypothetical protein
MKMNSKFVYKKQKLKTILILFNFLLLFLSLSTITNAQTCYCEETSSLKIGSNVGIETLTEAIALSVLADVTPSNPNAPPVNLCIDGDFTIDKSYYFNNSFIHVSPNTKISVAVGSHLGIISSEVYGCGSMWNSIYVSQVPYGQVNAGIEVSNSIIKDAEIAIDIGVHSDLSLEGSTFLNNYIGVRSTSSDGGVPNVLRFEGNTFRSDLNPLPPHANELMYAGVLLERVYGFTIGSISGGANAFLYLKNGIVAHASSFAVHNAGIFPSLPLSGPTPTSPNLNEDSGNGILSYRSSQVVTNTTFQDNTAAVHAVEAQALEVTDCTINETIAYGVVVVDKAGSIIIKDNDLECFQAGVYLSNISNALVNIEDNTITMVEENESPGIDGWAAIAIDGCNFQDFGNGFDRRANIKGNTIDLNDAWYGINLFASTGVNVVGNNTITFQGNDDFEFDPDLLAGINIQGGGDHIIKGNSVTGQGATVSLPDPDELITAVRVALSDGNEFCCNILNGTEVGTKFESVSLPSNFWGTNFGAHDVALLMDADGIIGEQDEGGNQWIASATMDVGARHENPNPFFCLSSQFLVQNLGLPETPIHPTEIDPNPQTTGANWFNTGGAAPQACCFWNFTPNEDPTKLDDDIAGGIINSGTTFSNTTNWQLERYLYKKLATHPDIVQQDQAMATFYNNKAATTVGVFHAIRDNIEGLAGQPSNDAQQYGANIESILTKLWRMVETDNLLVTATPQETAQLLAERSSIGNDLLTLEQQNNSLSTSIQTYRTGLVQQYLAQNAAIQTSATYEANEKTVNDVYLNTVALGNYSLSAQQRAALYPVTLQCPKMGGSTVFLARALYRLEDPSAIFYNDLNACSPPDALVASNNGQQQQALPSNKTFTFPNPANGEVTVVMAENVFADQVKLVHLNGQTVASYPLNEDVKRFTFSTAQVPPGIYLVKLMDGDKTIHTEKLAINR